MLLTVLLRHRGVLQHSEHPLDTPLLFYYVLNMNKPTAMYKKMFSHKKCLHSKMHHKKIILYKNCLISSLLVSKIDYYCFLTLCAQKIQSAK